MARKHTCDTLAILLMRGRRLDCDVATGEVFSIRKGVPVPKKTTPDKDGYLTVMLHRKSKKENSHGRKTVSLNARVNRLVKIKAMAVAKGGRNWRSFLAPLPLGVEVNHLGKRDDNRGEQLELSTVRANHGKTEMTDEEYAELQAAGW